MWILQGSLIFILRLPLKMRVLAKFGLGLRTPEPQALCLPEACLMVELHCFTMQSSHLGQRTNIQRRGRRGWKSTALRGVGEPGYSSGWGDREVGSLHRSVELEGRKSKAHWGEQQEWEAWESGQEGTARLGYEGRSPEVRENPIQEMHPRWHRLSVLSGTFIFFGLSDFLNPGSGTFRQGSVTELHPSPNVVFF